MYVLYRSGQALRQHGDLAILSWHTDVQRARANVHSCADRHAPEQDMQTNECLIHVWACAMYLRAPPPALVREQRNERSTRLPLLPTVTRCGQHVSLHSGGATETLQASAWLGMTFGVDLVGMSDGQPTRSTHWLAQKPRRQLCVKSIWCQLRRFARRAGEPAEQH
jgi:hypothetical protein